ncbi:short chain dehydrogenase/reductase family protein [Epithele typhae]|uniref:short chain dehydrogenase/reductase family protein n=1 Tax=Epithele typhae TaxID=378194 RepID=UPI002008072A|nr:short chain dehydrogenase/reductase family protein [Epithele typhae]KAH9940509.1 short chain dehydrogenase/reductase family protein [Epithele typhae]
MCSPKIILVTGSNQGLGWGIIKVAALRDPASTYIMCTRKLEAGQEGIQKLRADGVTAKVDLLQLDVTSDADITAAVKHVADAYGKLDVLVNNAGVLSWAPKDDQPIAEVRAMYAKVVDVNLTSLAVVTHAFLPLLWKSADPKVVGVSSGLGSIANTLTKKMGRTAPYGASKIGMNGFSVHMQVKENDRVAAEKDGREPPSGRTPVRYFVCQPGVLKTALLNFYAAGREPERGAEVAVRLALDDKFTYEGGSYWEYEDEEMKRVPW